MDARVRHPSYPEGVDAGEQPSLPPPRFSTVDTTTDVRERALRIAQEVFTRGLASTVSAAGQHFSPRPHQLDAVASLLEAVYLDGGSPTPTNYLLQHSTGSGKSFTIAALVVALAGWRDCSRGVIGSVLVLNDRLQLDHQLGTCVKAFWKGNGRPVDGLRRAATTSELSSFLSAPLGAPGRPHVVLTTVQKLATLWRAGGGRAAGGGAGSFGGGEGGLTRIVVIADEAHRHHGRGSTDQIHQILASVLGSAGSGAGGRDGSGGSKRPQHRQQPRGLTYLGFTATPSPKALQLFGVVRELPSDTWITRAEGRGGDGDTHGHSDGLDGTRVPYPVRQTPAATPAPRPQLEKVLPGEDVDEGDTALLYAPFHAYTMRNAVQDGFVLDVLRSYTAVTPRLQIAGVRESARLMGESRASPDGGVNLDAGSDLGSRARFEAAMAEEVLVESASNSRDVVDRKATYIVERFTTMWRTASDAGFTSLRGIVVARSRQHVVWFVQALRRAVAENDDFRKLHEAAAAADPQDAAASQRGPLIFGAFSGSISLSAAEVADLQRQRRQWDQCVKSIAATTAEGTATEYCDDDDDDRDAGTEMTGVRGGSQGIGGGEEGEGPPRKRRRRDVDIGVMGGDRRGRRPMGHTVRSLSGWDAALLHLDGASDETHGLVEGLVPAPPSCPWRLRVRQRGRNNAHDSEGGDVVPELGIGSYDSVEDIPVENRDSGSSGEPSSSNCESASELSEGSDSRECQRAHMDRTSSEATPGEAAGTGCSSDTAIVGAVRECQHPVGEAAGGGRVHGTCDGGSISSPHDMTRLMSSSAVGLDNHDGCGPAENLVVQVTEVEVNGRRADPGAARLLVVCSKYETGYDDPRLGSLFIDRVLTGARAVQVLGRLNRPAPTLCKSHTLLGVVDFVNSVGALREAFEEFYDVTTLHTGKLARQLRQERQMERALTRILELLQPAADRAAALAPTRRTAASASAASTSTASASAASASAAAASGGLMFLGVSEMAALASVYLAPEGRRALEADLYQYVALAGSLRMEMPEMPLPFAAALLSKITADRQERERAAACLRVTGAGPDNSGGGGGGSTQGDLPDLQVAVCELEETFSGAIYLAGTRVQQLPPAPATAAVEEAAATTGCSIKGGSVVISGVPSSEAGADGKFMSGTDNGRAVAAAAVPLRGRPIQGWSWGRQGASAAAVARSGGGGSGSRARGRLRAAAGAGAGGGCSSFTVDRKVLKNRPLSEVIAAANASLDIRYERQLAAGFREVAARLAAAAAPGSTGAAASYDEDVYELLSLLRRLSLWPVTVDQLRVMSVGREVSKLRKHSNPQVANLARTLVARWKAITIASSSKNSTTTIAVAAAATRGNSGAIEGAAASASGTSPASASRGAAAVDETLRGKVRSLLEGSLRSHVEAVARIRNRDVDLSDLDSEQLGLLAQNLEVAVFKAHGRDGVSYRSQTRMLVGALKHADGVASDLLSGAIDPRVVAIADSMSLAPASVRAQVEELARRKRLETEAWEKLVGQGGGASTYKSARTVCPSCGGSGATVHNVLSGGTYAQERVQIQKFVCDHCGSTWRND